MLALLGTAGCGSADLSGHYWDVTLSGSVNECTDGANYNERLDYRVVYNGNDVTLYIGEDLFATGRTEGCGISYQSIVWGETRDGYDVKWQIFGAANVEQGGAGCVDGALDWSGTETFQITFSEHPDISAGCTYTLDVTGTYTEEIE